MARPDDEYWTKSSNKGFNFDEDNFPQVLFHVNLYKFNLLVGICRKVHLVHYAICLG